MTYAAQVRNVSKSVSHPQTEEDFYDINSLRIICKYFVGSIVTVKTADEIIEGVLHTISHNKICLTLVTCAKCSEQEKITETASSKLISLSDVLFISTNNNTAQEVTVKGRYIKINKEINGKDKKNNNHNVKLSNNNNVKVLTKVELEPNDNNIKTEDQYNKSIELNSKHLENSVSTEINRKNEEPKKTFSFNPNAPEFKPRTNTFFSENVNSHLIFSPHPQPYPSVFTPNSASAIFVPNLFFYAPNQSMNNIESRSFDSNIANSNSPDENNMDILSDKNLPDEQFSRKPIPEMHIAASPGMPIPHVLPFLPPPVQIFVPHNPFKFNTLPTFSSNPDDTEESDDVSENNELSNPSNWPPLPLPVKHVSNNNNSNHPNTNSENQKFP